MLTVDYIKEVVGKYFDVDMNLPSRKKKLVRSRQIMMFLCREYLGLSYKEIGVPLGKNHSTVYHGRYLIKSLYVTDAGVRATIDTLRVILNAKINRDDWLDKSIGS